MNNILFIAEYDGTDFHGWQRQESLRTVQGVLEDALSELMGSPQSIRSSSRTDSGVHGKAHPFNLVTESELPLKAYLGGVNSKLPLDVRIQRVARMVPEFDSRSDSKGKTYCYRIYNSRIPSPLLMRYAWHVKPALDIERMNLAARHFLGEWDMSSFRSAHCDSKSTMRLISEVCTRRVDGNLLEIRITANAFLRNMVRIMVGCLVDVGRHAQEPDWIRELILAKDRTLAGRTAAAHGLMLERVYYPEGLVLEELGQPQHS